MNQSASKHIVRFSFVFFQIEKTPKNGAKANAEIIFERRPRNKVKANLRDKYLRVGLI